MNNKYDNIINGLSDDEKIYADLLIIRRFEENLLKLFGENKLFGTTHTCIGQEAVAVGVMSAVTDKDIVFSNHRCHGHFIAYSHHPELLLKEIMGKTNSLCEGRGGSQHIHYKNFFTNGVQGGIVPNTVGAALSEKRKGSGGIGIVFLGDGTLGQGVVYESFNMAMILNVPVLFVVENNKYAMSTRTEDALSGNIADRATAFGIKSLTVDGNDVIKVKEAAQNAISKVRESSMPYMLICDTYRLAAHSKGDDFRLLEEVESHRKYEPVYLAAKKIDVVKKLSIDESVDKYIAGIIDDAEKEQYAILSASEESVIDRIDITPVPKQKRYADYINFALAEALSDENTIIIGEDIRDPYGGAFKVTKGLSTKFPTQVYNTPISEAAIAGISVGAALNGTRVIAEIMFGDFITLAIDQLLNHASKYKWIYRNGKSVPMVMRTPMGGKRGYGPTHSQSLEKYLVGIPDVNVIVLSELHNPVYLYRQLLRQNNPTVIIENKLLYTRSILNIDEKGMIDDFYVKKIHNYIVPTYVLSFNEDYSNDLTIVTYGGMLADCMEVAKTLMIDDEISVNIMVLGQLSEFPIKDIMEVSYGMDEIVFVEEGTVSYGIGAEFICRIAEKGIGSKYLRIAAPDSPIPNSLIQEIELLPSVDSIIKKVRAFV